MERAEADRAFAERGVAEIAGFFTTPEFDRLRRHVDGKTRRRLFRSMQGDGQVGGAPCEYGDPLAERLLHVKAPFLSERLQLDLVPTYSYLRLYRPGDRLPAHRDRPACEITVSASLAIDTHWPLYMLVDGDILDFCPAPRDALAFKGQELLHWREPLSGNALVAQILLHYVQREGSCRSWAYRSPPDSSRGVGEERLVLVTFEGLDCAGKSSLIREVAAGLRATLREPVLHLADISRSPTGRRLGEVFHADELFGKGNVGSTVMSRCLAATADLFYFDGALIAPMAAAGGVVLKERHIDTIISHEGPALAKQEGWSDHRAEEWLRLLVAPLQVRPSLTILVEAPLNDRERRLRERAGASGTVFNPITVEVDRAVFQVRAEWYGRLQSQEESRWRSVSNPDGGLAAAVGLVTAEIVARASCPSCLRVL